MNRYGQSRPKRTGVSLIELLIVVAISLIVGAVAIPQVSRVSGLVRLRSSMTSVSGLLRNARSGAILRNKTMTIRHSIPADSSDVLYYVKGASDTASLRVSDAQVLVSRAVTVSPAPEGARAPVAISAIDLGFEPVGIDALAQTFASFNSRGLACAYVGGTCQNSGFVEYFKHSRSMGQDSWAAVSVSPAGRICLWFWNGAAWTK